MAKRGVAREEQEALIASTDEIIPSSYDADIEKDGAPPPKTFTRQSSSGIEAALASKPLRTGMLIISVLIILANLPTCQAYSHTMQGDGRHLHHVCTHPAAFLCPPRPLAAERTAPPSRE